MKFLLSMKLLLAVYATILLLGIAAMVTPIHHFANVAGFIAAIGFLLIFFKDPEKDITEEKKAQIKKFKKYWYLVFAFGFFFSLIFGTFWNHQMGGMG